MLGRRLSRWLWARPLWQRALLAAAFPLCALNLSVSLLGRTVIFPLSPFFLAEKAQAVVKAVGHRAGCILSGHGDLAPVIAEAEQRHKLPRGLLAALVEVESRSNPHRISAAGAMGPAQLTAATADYLGVADPFDPRAGIDGGARYLSAQIRRFGDLRLAVAAYNAGPGSVRGGKVPRNGETEYYVEKVMAEYARRAPPDAAQGAPVVRTRPSPR